MNRQRDEIRLREELARGCFNLKDYEEGLVTNIFYVEKELGVYIDDDYPATKLFVQIEELKKHYDKEKKEYDKANRRR